MDERLRENRTTIAASIAIGIAALIAIAAIFGLGPCGGELSQEEFVDQGDEICAEAQDEFLELQAATPRTATDAAELMSALIEVAEEERDAIADLDAPAELDDRVSRYLDAREAGIAQLRAGLGAAKDDDPEAYERIQQEVGQSQRGRHKIARKVGFTECSKPLQQRG